MVLLSTVGMNSLTSNARVLDRPAGFTLLELLVSIVILSLIVTISYSALRVGSRSWQATTNIINTNSTSRFAVQFIRTKMEQLYPIYWLDGGRRLVAFQGEEDSVKFIAPAPQGREANEYFEYYLVTDTQDDGSLSLVLFFEPHDPSRQSFEVNRNSPYREILSNLEAVKYSYYGYQQKTKMQDWRENWEESSKDYPTLIKIEMDSQEFMNKKIDIAVDIRSEINSNNIKR
jgi:general secretion pathway protein J